MMKKILTIALLTLLALGANAQLNKVYDETLDPMTQIDQAVLKAKAEGKFVICQVGGNWCPWCLKFAKFITDDESIRQIIEENFVYIHVNYHPRKSGEAGKAMLKRLGNAGRFGYPVLVVLDGDGKVVHIQNSAYLEDGESYNQKKVLDFFKHWTPAAVNPKE
ncbi:MAG: thioredoxin family protein [Muribaculaceae bacterium]|nr:thioredoxin family protein [Muribaculaceae bacterium]